MNPRTVQPASTAVSWMRALASSFKRPGAVQALQPVTLQMPGLGVYPAHVSAYVDVCGFQVAHHAPMTYGQLLAFPLVMAYITSADCPWPAMGTVHLANDITQHQPLLAGDVLRAQLTPGELRAHPKGQVFDLHLSLWRDADGVCVWQACMSLLRVGVSPAVGSIFNESPDLELNLNRQTGFAAPPDIGRRYARISGDFNPIHLSALSARLFGFKRAIAHGLWTQARALACLQQQGVDRPARLKTLFKRPLMLPAQTTVFSASIHPTQTVFEARDAQGEHIYLHSELSFISPAQTP
jgi:acyl dehydratase